MAQQSNDLRERLLAALPQPENLAAYREETAALLAKHATALRWDKIAANLLSWLAVLMFWWGVHLRHSDGLASHSLQFGGALLGLAGVMFWVRYDIYASQIATLKEVKQVQLQILELQASLRKNQ